MPFNYDAVKDLIRCPRSKSELLLDGSALVCLDPDCRLQFAIRDDIPCLLEDEARPLAPDEWSALLRRHGRGTPDGIAG